MSPVCTPSQEQTSGGFVTGMAERYARQSQAAMHAVASALDGDPLVPGA